MIDLQKLGRISPWNPANALKPEDPVLESFLDFTDKEFYFMWRTDWRNQYDELSGQIRALRAVWRSQGSAHEMETHNALFNARAVARSMLAIRKASKAKAERLYQEAKTAEAVA